MVIFSQSTTKWANKQKLISLQTLIWPKNSFHGYCKAFSLSFLLFEYSKQSQSFSHHEPSKIETTPSNTMPRKDRSTTIPRKPSRTRSARIVNKTNSMPNFAHDQSLKQLQSELLQVKYLFGLIFSFLKL